MKIIAFTLPYFIDHEHLMIQRILDSGVTYVHVRKLECDISDLEHLIRAIPPQYHPRLTIHEHFSLTDSYAIGGIHLNKRWPNTFNGFNGRVSRSCHSIYELAHYSTLTYCTLSPIFNSISKEGYASQFSNQDLLDARDAGILNERTIALGGVMPANIAQLNEWGFGGAAVLGVLWASTQLDDVEQVCKQLLENKDYK